jgi:CSLREA domain-containing protein
MPQNILGGKSNFMKLSVPKLDILIVILFFIAISIIVVLTVPVTQADTIFTVDSTLDVVDENPGNGDCATASGDCTLRAAIQEANALSGDDTIILPSGIYTLTIQGLSEDNAATGDLDIKDDLIINGAGEENTIINANKVDRALHITGSYSVSLSNLTIKNGHTRYTTTGGGINNQGGSLTIDTCAIVDNTALGVGGGFYSTGILNINNSTLSGNYGSTGGGLVNSGESSIVGCVIHSNDSQSSGGGIYNSGSMLIVNSSIVSNTAPYGFGGGIGNGSILTVTHSILVGNSAYGGGGISTSGGAAYFSNSIIGGNTDSNYGNLDCFGTVTSRGYNVIQSPSKCYVVGNPVGNVTGQNPNLGPLQDNGGPTWSLALLSGSPAIDAGSCQGVTLDQRGYTRPFDVPDISNAVDGCDIGPYEYGASASVPPTLIYVPLVLKQ